MEQQFNELKTLWEDFELNHLKFTEKGNKAAASKARVTLGEIKKKITSYRQASVEATKK